MIRFERPEDFRVEEVALYPPAGEGSHTFVRVEKRNRTTEEVARELARVAGARPRDVGYAGRKDKLAVATQWFSVPGLAPELARVLTLREARVLEAVAHPHKLRTGQLRANRFELVVRGVAPEGVERAPERLARLVERGLPNRFGPQRFGVDGGNVEAGRRLLAGAAPVRDRRRARFLISALQAAAFNAVLAERECPAILEAGDVAVVHTSGGLFLVEDVAAEAPRAAAFEISPTGPIFGTRVLQPAGEPAERERRVLAAFGVDADALRPPRGIRLRGSRRPLRVRPEEAAAESAGPGALRLRFTLPPGSYATVLVEELLHG